MAFLFSRVEWIVARPSRLLMGIPFSATLLAILFSHEMGHYLFCRHYRVRATLAVFHSCTHADRNTGSCHSHQGAIRSRTALFDIGIAGPIAGFAVAVSALVVAITLSKPLTPGMPHSDLRLGFPQIFYLVQ